MSDDLTIGILRDIQKQQLETATSLGRIEEKVDNVVKVKDELAEDVEKLKQKDWKQSGAIAAILVLWEMASHYVSKKLFP